MLQGLGAAASFGFSVSPDVVHGDVDVREVLIRDAAMGPERRRERCEIEAAIDFGHFPERSSWSNRWWITYTSTKSRGSARPNSESVLRITSSSGAKLGPAIMTVGCWQPDGMVVRRLEPQAQRCRRPSRRVRR